MAGLGPRGRTSISGGRAHSLRQEGDVASQTEFVDQSHRRTHVGKPPFRNRKWGGQVRGQLRPDPQRIPPATNPKPVWPSPEETGFTAPVGLTEIPLLHLEAFLVLASEKAEGKERAETAGPSLRCVQRARMKPDCAGCEGQRPVSVLKEAQLQGRARLGACPAPPPTACRPLSRTPRVSRTELGEAALKVPASSGSNKTKFRGERATERVVPTACCGRANAE